MNVDHSHATAIVSFRGLGLLCFDESGTAQIGFLKHPEHIFDLQISRIDAGRNSTSIDPGLDVRSDIQIQTVLPEAHDTRYESGEFDRRGDLGDPEDFRWLIDLEGSEVNNRHLTVNRGNQLGFQLLGLTVSDGLFYTSELSHDSYARVRIDSS